MLTTWSKHGNLHKPVVTEYQQKGPHLIILSLQKKLQEVHSSVLVQMRKLNKSISKLEAELSVTKQVITLLSSGLVSIECHCWLNTQYSRWEFLDIAGIPSEVEADPLEEKVVAVFGKLGCNVPIEYIKACHRISKKSPITIVKPSRKKDCQQVWDIRRDLRKIKIEVVDLPDQKHYL